MAIGHPNLKYISVKSTKADVSTYEKHTDPVCPLLFSVATGLQDKLLAVGPHLLYAIKAYLEKEEITKPIKFSGLTKPCFLKTVCKTDIVYFP